MQDPMQLPVPTQFACGKDHTVVAAQGKFYGFGKGEQGQFGHVKGLQEVDHGNRTAPGHRGGRKSEWRNDGGRTRSTSQWQSRSQVVWAHRHCDRHWTPFSSLFVSLLFSVSSC